MQSNDAPASRGNKGKEPTGVGGVNAVSVQVTSGRNGWREGIDSWWRWRRRKRTTTAIVTGTAGRQDNYGQPSQQNPAKVCRHQRACPFRFDSHHVRLP